MADGYKNVLAFGDSNAWGWVPRLEIFPSDRLPKGQRWPDILAEALGAGWVVFFDALPGRTTALEDETVELGPGAANGLARLPAAIAAHMPLDLVIIALGTNDFKEPFGRSVEQIASDILELGAEVALNSGISTTYAPARALILCPPPLGLLHPEEWVREVFSQNSLDRSKALATVLGPKARAAGHGFFDAGSVMATEGVDGVHFSAENHRSLGRALAPVVRGFV